MTPMSYRKISLEQLYKVIYDYALFIHNSPTLEPYTWHYYPAPTFLTTNPTKPKKVAEAFNKKNFHTITDIIIEFAYIINDQMRNQDKALALLELAMNSLLSKKPYHRINFFSHKTCSEKLYNAYLNIQFMNQFILKQQTEISAARKRIQMC